MAGMWLPQPRAPCCCPVAASRRQRSPWALTGAPCVAAVLRSPRRRRVLAVCTHCCRRRWPQRGRHQPVLAVTQQHVVGGLRLAFHGCRRALWFTSTNTAAASAPEQQECVDVCLCVCACVVVGLLWRVLSSGCQRPAWCGGTCGRLRVLGCRRHEGRPGCGRCAACAHVAAAACSRVGWGPHAAMCVGVGARPVCLFVRWDVVRHRQLPHVCVCASLFALWRSNACACVVGRGVWLLLRACRVWCHGSSPHPTARQAGRQARCLHTPHANPTSPCDELLLLLGCCVV